MTQGPAHNKQGDTSSISPQNSIRMLSMIAVIAIAVSIPLFWGNALKGLPVVLDKARAPKGADETRTVLIIDGNRDGYTATFKHDEHKKRLGGKQSCKECHHLSNPGDKDTACFHCHTRMEQPTDIFDHNLHINKLKGNKGCDKCHTDPAAPRWATNAKDCDECHEKDMGITKQADGKRFNHSALSYHDAMHKLCIECHRKKDLSAEQSKAMEECQFCHQKQKKAHVK